MVNQSQSTDQGQFEIIATLGLDKVTKSGFYTYQGVWLFTVIFMSF